MLETDVDDNKRIGKFGAEDIVSRLNGENAKILTHCNTGELATAGYGTALGVIRHLRELGKLGNFSIIIIFYVCPLIFFLCWSIFA